MDEALAEFIQQARTYRHRLMAEVRKTDRILAQLGASRGPTQMGRGAAHGTYTLLNQLSDELQPGEVVSVDQALTWMLSHGWETPSKNKRNTVACALARLGTAGRKFAWESQGKYRKPDPGEATEG